MEGGGPCDGAVPLEVGTGAGTSASARARTRPPPFDPAAFDEGRARRLQNLERVGERGDWRYTEEWRKRRREVGPGSDSGSVRPPSGQQRRLADERFRRADVLAGRAVYASRTMSAAGEAEGARLVIVRRRRADDVLVRDHVCLALFQEVRLDTGASASAGRAEPSPELVLLPLSSTNTLGLDLARAAPPERRPALHPFASAVRMRRDALAVRDSVSAELPPAVTAVLFHVREQEHRAAGAGAGAPAAGASADVGAGACARKSESASAARACTAVDELDDCLLGAEVRVAGRAPVLLLWEDAEELLSARGVGCGPLLRALGAWGVACSDGADPASVRVREDALDRALSPSGAWVARSLVRATILAKALTVRRAGPAPSSACASAAQRRRAFAPVPAPAGVRLHASYACLPLALEAAALNMLSVADTAEQAARAVLVRAPGAEKAGAERVARAVFDAGARAFLSLQRVRASTVRTAHLTPPMLDMAERLRGAVAHVKREAEAVPARESPVPLFFGEPAYDAAIRAMDAGEAAGQALGTDPPGAVLSALARVVDEQLAWLDRALERWGGEAAEAGGGLDAPEPKRQRAEQGGPSTPRAA
jgi:hypothetical protein